MNKKILFFSLMIITAISGYARSAQDKVIVAYKPDKTVSIIYPAPESRKPKESNQEFLARIYQRAVANDASLQRVPLEIIDGSRLPSREFRDAWEGEPGKGIVLNKEKVQKIKKEILKQQLLAEEKEKILEELAIEKLKKQGKE